MNILHVNGENGNGGVANVILQLSEQQSLLGHNVDICLPYGSTKGAFDQSALLVSTLEVENRVWCHHALQEYIQSNQYDIVHAHWGIWLETALACNHIKQSFLYTDHGGFSRKKYLIRHRLANFLTQNVVIISPSQKRYVGLNWGVPERKLILIPNGIDIERFSSAEPAKLEDIPDDAPVIGMVSRLCPPKDFDTFIRAAILVHATCPGCHFVIVGDGPLRAELESLVKKGLAADYIHFLGNRNDVASISKRLITQVLSSRNEGMGLVLAEAMAAKTPVIGTDIPAIRWVLDDGNAGILTPPGDVVEMAEAMNILLQDEVTRSRFQMAGLERVQQFSAKAMAEKYLKLYKQIIDTKKDMR